MLIKVLGSSSAGNQYILEAENGNQLLLECGIKYEKVASFIKFDKVKGLIMSHIHKDHSLEKDRFKSFGIDIYDHSNLKSGELKTINDFQVMPMAVKHGHEPCFSFLIKADNKKILFCTDLEQLPPLVDRECYDIALIECNFSQDIIYQRANEGKSVNLGCWAHLSLEKLLDWLNNRKYKPKILVLIHLSNSSLIDIKKAKESCEQYVDKVYLATKGLEIEF